jgi:ankyrin repeat protein
MLAAIHGDKEVIELLLNNGADPSAVHKVRGNDDDDDDDECD